MSAKFAAPPFAASLQKAFESTICFACCKKAVLCAEKKPDQRSDSFQDKINARLLLHLEHPRISQCPPPPRKESELSDVSFCLDFQAGQREKRRHYHERYPVELRKSLRVDIGEIEVGQYDGAAHGKHGGEDKPHYYRTYAAQSALNVLAVLNF